MSRIAPQLDFSNKPVAATAMRIAVNAHDGQVRKFTGEPYIHHPMRVAETVLKVGVVDQEVLAAALLHDVLEDTSVRPFQISEACGAKVRRWVEYLTEDKTVGDRRARKARVITHLRNAPEQVKIIKYADMIDNVPSMTDYAEPDFAEQYLREKETLADAAVPTSVAGAEIRRMWLGVRAEAMNRLALTRLNLGRALEATTKAEDEYIASIIREEERSIYAEVAMF